MRIETSCSRISALFKKTPESILTPPARWGHSQKTAIHEPGGGSSPDTESASALILDFQPADCE